MQHFKRRFRETDAYMALFPILDALTNRIFQLSHILGPVMDEGEVLYDALCIVNYILVGYKIELKLSETMLHWTGYNVVMNKEK